MLEITHPNTHLFLDLEYTIITPISDGWHLSNLINVDKIKDFVVLVNPIKVHVFSFALWNPSEVEQFDLFFKKEIEDALGISFNMVPMLDTDIILACCKELNIHPYRTDRGDIIDFVGKAQAFLHFSKYKLPYLLENHESAHVILIDDVVPDMEFSFPKLKLTGELINVVGL